MKAALGRVGEFLRLIRFEHTLFALPYALAGTVLAARGWPRLAVFLWIIVAMVGARTAAMAFNRLVDRRFDAANPRTAGRASATGSVGPAYLVGAVLLSAALFVFAAAMLNRLALTLAVPTLVVLLGYSLVKRFWHQSHLVLGIALGLSPLGAWVAVRGDLEGAWPVLFLGAAVTVWTNGFDILYACQDLDFDRSAGLRSVPARFGMSRALLVARLSHALVPVFLVLCGLGADLGLFYFLAVALVTVLLVYEHGLVREDDLSRINQAFFTVNVVIGFIVLAGTLVDVFRIGSP